MSCELGVQIGEALGSVLGPFIFVLFINDLPQWIMSDCYGYADDYKIVGTNNITMQIETAIMWKWCTENLKKLNLSQCKVLL